MKNWRTATRMVPVLMRATDALAVKVLSET